MSTEEETQAQADEAKVARAVDALPVPRPDTQPDPNAKVDSLGRSMANKRGRKPGVKYASNGTTKSAPAAQQEQGLSDEMVGKALAGIFSLGSLAMGPHWRLMKQEEEEMGRTFGPFARILGPEAFGLWLVGLSALPTAVGIIAPRFAVEGLIAKKQFARPDGRRALLMFKASMVAEGMIDIDRQVKESEDYLKELVKAGASAVAINENKVNNATTVVQPNGAITEKPSA